MILSLHRIAVVLAAAVAVGVGAARKKASGQKTKGHVNGS